MKKVLLVVSFLAFYSIQSFGITYYAERYALWDSAKIKELDSLGFFDGNINQTNILEKNKDYIVIRNTSVNSTMEYRKQKVFPEIFLLEADSHCKKQKKFKYTIFLSDLDKHTVYALCGISLANILDPNFSFFETSKSKYEYNLSFSSTCFGFNKSEDAYKNLSCDDKIEWILKRWPDAKIQYNNLVEREKKFKDRNFIFKVKKKVFANKDNKQIEGDVSKIIPASSGTGFFVSHSGHMVTNNHVIDSCDTVKAHYKGRELEANVLFTDRSNDLAIIKANIKPNKVFAVSNEDVSLLEDIIVAGYPLGKNISASIKTFKGSVTALAGFGDNYSNFQIDASLSSGNSGGPIINQKGNVVGVAVEKLVEVGVEGFNFGVKSSTLKTFASSNQFKFQDPSTEELSNKELGQLITEATIYLECWMSVAKINQIIEEGERQKAFFSDYK